jgi:hypothetical protein
MPTYHDAIAGTIILLLMDKGKVNTETPYRFEDERYIFRKKSCSTNVSVSLGRIQFRKKL